MLPFDAAPSLHARRVDDDELSPVLLEPHVDRIARRTGQLAHDHSFLASESVDERRLAGVLAPDDGELHHGLFVVIAAGLEPLDDGLEDVGAADALERAHRNGSPSPSSQNSKISGSS